MDLNSIKVSQKVKMVSVPAKDSIVGYISIIHDKFLGKVCTVIMVDSNGAAAIWDEDLETYCFVLFENLEVVDDTIQVEISFNLGDKVEVLGVPSEDSFGSTPEMEAIVGTQREINKVRITPNLAQIAYGIQLGGKQYNASYFEAGNLKLV